MNKKILVIHHSGLLGGAGVSLKAMIAHLDKHFDVKVYLPQDPPNLSEYLSKDGFDIRLFKGRLAKITVYSGGNKFWSLRFIYHSLKIPVHFVYWFFIILRERPDVVLVNSRVLCWFSLIPCRAKMICFVRETVDKSSRLTERFLIRPLLSLFSARVFLSRYDKYTHNFSDENSVISPDFSDPDIFTVLPSAVARARIGIAPNSFVACFVGGVDPLKGLSVLLRAVDTLGTERPDLTRHLRVIICGDLSESTLLNYKPYYSEDDYSIVRRFLKCGEDKIFIKLGLQRDLSLAYSACDFLVFPMVKPHQSRPAFEVGYFGKPVVISDFENIHEFYLDRINCIRFKPLDSSELAKAFSELYYDRSKLASLGHRNKDISMSKRHGGVCLRPLVNLIEHLSRP